MEIVFDTKNSRIDMTISLLLYANNYKINIEKVFKEFKYMNDKKEKRKCFN